MEISFSLVCPCNGKLYKSAATLKAHHKSQGHIIWEQNKDQKDLTVKINRLENENGHLRRLNILLMEKISEMKLI